MKNTEDNDSWLNHPCWEKFDEWCKDRGEYPDNPFIEIDCEIWNAAWNAAIEAALLKTPGGSICDPQAVADEIRSLISPIH